MPFSSFSSSSFM
ncbi:BgTH12-01406 [Blumeria graminis f. sp. triticale]|nr:BgTH12-01406 [Blumeria graminis f. sp. triticale]